MRTISRLGLALAALALACGDSSDERATSGPLRIRLSTSIGLKPVIPGVQASFSRHLVELVYVPADRMFAEIRPTDGGYLLPIRHEANRSPTELATALRHPRLVSAKAADGAVELHLSEGPPPKLEELFLDLGPFTQESFSDAKLVLRRRSSETQVERIEVFRAASEQEEWRRFLGRESDLVPFLSPSALTYLREVPSVRIVPYVEAGNLVLFFRCDSPPVAEAATRRTIAAQLRRPAIAKLAVGDAAAAAPAPKLEEPRRGLEGTNLRLAFYAASRDHELAAMVIEQQLLELGFKVVMVPMDAAELQASIQAGGFDLLVFEGGSDRTQLGFLTTAHPGNIAHYHNDAFDRAVGDGRLDDARDLIAADVPLTPLLSVRDHVAIDRRLCGVHPIAPRDLSWLADLHMCAPGETE